MEVERFGVVEGGRQPDFSTRQSAAPRGHDDGAGAAQRNDSLKEPLPFNCLLLRVRNS
jgi:hypothetical protein